MRCSSRIDIITVTKDSVSLAVDTNRHLIESLSFLLGYWDISTIVFNFDRQLDFLRIRTCTNENYGKSKRRNSDRKLNVELTEHDTPFVQAMGSILKKRCLFANG